MRLDPFAAGLLGCSVDLIPSPRPKGRPYDVIPCEPCLHDVLVGPIITPVPGRRIALLVEGGLFSAVPTNDLEPFTVVAQSLCEAMFFGHGYNRYMWFARREQKGLW